MNRARTVLRTLSRKIIKGAVSFAFMSPWRHKPQSTLLGKVRWGTSTFVGTCFWLALVYDWGGNGPFPCTGALGHKHYRVDELWGIPSSQEKRYTIHFWHNEVVSLDKRGLPGGTTMRLG